MIAPRVNRMAHAVIPSGQDKSLCQQGGAACVLETVSLAVEARAEALCETWQAVQAMAATTPTQTTPNIAYFFSFRIMRKLYAQQSIEFQRICSPGAPCLAFETWALPGRRVLSHSSHLFDLHGRWYRSHPRESHSERSVVASASTRSEESRECSRKRCSQHSLDSSLPLVAQNDSLFLLKR